MWRPQVLVGQGKPVAEAIRTIGVTEPTYYRCRAEFGGLKLDHARRLKQREQENGRLSCYRFDRYEPKTGTP